MIGGIPHPPHCESGEVLWLQGEAASQTHSFRDAEPQPVIPPNANKNHGKFPKKLRPGISTSMSTTDLCLPNTAWQWSVVCYYRISQLGPRNGTEYFLVSVFLWQAVWLCLKMGSGNIVLIRLLQIGAEDLTVGPVNSPFSIISFKVCILYL